MFYIVLHNCSDYKNLTRYTWKSRTKTLTWHDNRKIHDCKQLSKIRGQDNQIYLYSSENRFLLKYLLF